MHALILDDDCRRQVALSVALSRQGFMVGCVAGQRVAEACIRQGALDLLVMPERLWGQLTHSLALLAEWRHPAVATLILTERDGPDAEELYLLLPSLHALLPPDVRPERLARVAVAAVSAATARAAAGGRLVLDDDQRVDRPADPAGAEPPPAAATATTPPPSPGAPSARASAEAGDRPNRPAADGTGPAAAGRPPLLFASRRSALGRLSVGSAA